MMDRVNFLESVSGILYPGMIVDFFDHFIALKQIVEEYGKVNVLDVDNNIISFSITFANLSSLQTALQVINTCNAVIVIYGRPISVQVEVLTDSEVKIKLQ